ncbi:unnamed protein product [Rhizophagus irregularis]|nr:unnamed protein product [Rhizophagus irregularis]
MSSYSSLSRVLSPFRVQTKFEEKTLPARYTDIMVFCLVQDKLTLWRVDIVQTKENQEMTIKEHKGVELHSFESVGTHFQDVPLSTNIRIIVQPLLPATTGPSHQGVPQVTSIEDAMKKILEGIHKQMDVDNVDNNKPKPMALKQRDLKQAIDKLPRQRQTIESFYAVGHLA